MEHTNSLLSRKQAAEYLNVKPQTLAAWACNRRYALPVVRIGRTCRYRPADLAAWIAARTVGADTEGVARD